MEEPRYDEATTMENTTNSPPHQDSHIDTESTAETTDTVISKTPRVAVKVVSTSQCNTRKRKPVQSEMGDAMNILKDIAAGRSLNKAECTVFAERVALKLRKFDEITRSEVEHKINCILYAEEMKILKRQRPPASSLSEYNTPSHDSTAASPSAFTESDIWLLEYSSPSQQASPVVDDNSAHVSDNTYSTYQEL